MNGMTSCEPIALALGLCLLAPLVYADAEFFSLGFFGAPAQTQVSAVSPDGSVAVGSSADGQDIYFNTFDYAFVWRKPGPIQPMSTSSTGLTDVLENFGSGASDGGAVLVGTEYSRSTYDSSAFYWKQSQGAVSLGDLPGGRNQSSATGISHDGAVIVGSGVSTNGTEAFIWTISTGMIGLGDLSGGTFGSRANAVSGDGFVVVGSGTSTNGEEAIRWTASGGMVGLGDLPGGNFFSVATGVSFDGSVIVGMSSSASSARGEAFRWTQEMGLVGLGDLPGGLFTSRANAVSGDGSVVVGYGTMGNNVQDTVAMIWDAEHGMRRLQTVLTSDYGLDLSGWTLTEARSISRDGRVIVGRGNGPSTGQYGSWMAVLPSSLIPSYGGWCAQYGLSTNGIGSGASEACPAGDGIPNLVKAALGIDPWSLGYQGAFGCGVRQESGTNYFAVTMRRPEPAPRGFAYMLETSTNLQHWTEGEMRLSEHSLLQGQRTLTYIEPWGMSLPRLFVRLKIQLVE